MCPTLLRGFADSMGNRECVCNRQPRAHELALAPYLQRDAFRTGAIYAHCRRFLGTYVIPVVRIIFQTNAAIGYLLLSLSYYSKPPEISIPCGYTCRVPLRKPVLNFWKERRV